MLHLRSRDAAPTMKQTQKYGNMSWKQILKSNIGFAGYVCVIVGGVWGISAIYSKYLKNGTAAKGKETSNSSNTQDEKEELPLEEVPADSPITAEEMQKTDSVFSNVIARKSGYGIVVAPHNEGKTTFLEQLAMSLASGQPTFLMGDIPEKGLKPQNVIMYCAEQEQNEMLRLGNSAYPDVPDEAKHRIKYICKDKCRITPQKALNDLRDRIINGQDDVFAIYDCIGSDYFTNSSERLQAELREKCEDLVRLANEKGILFQLVIACHVLGGTYRIGNKIDTVSMRLSDTLIHGSRYILGITPIGEEHSRYKYLKVLRCKDYPEPNDVSVIKWRENSQRFEFCARKSETEVLSNASEYIGEKVTFKSKRGATPKVTDDAVTQALISSKNQKEAAKMLGITEGALSQRISKRK